MSDTDLLRAVSPDLAAQRGIPQNKVPGEDLWDHTLRAVDAAPAARPVVRLATLLHDIGKPATFADGHFVGHDAVGAELAGAFMDRLRLSRPVHDRIVELVRNHMFSYEPNWSDAAVRRFIAKMEGIGPGTLEELLELREADNIGSGLPAEAGRNLRSDRPGRSRRCVSARRCGPRCPLQPRRSARATTPGVFVRPPAHAEEMYNPAVFGESDGGMFTVTAKGK